MAILVVTEAGIDYASSEESNYETVALGALLGSEGVFDSNEAIRVVKTTLDVDQVTASDVVAGLLAHGYIGYAMNQRNPGNESEGYWPGPVSRTTEAGKPGQYDRTKFKKGKNK